MYTYTTFCPIRRPSLAIPTQLLLCPQSSPNIGEENPLKHQVGPKWRAGGCNKTPMLAVTNIENARYDNTGNTSNSEGVQEKHREPLIVPFIGSTRHSCLPGYVSSPYQSSKQYYSFPPLFSMLRPHHPDRPAYC